MNVMRVTRGLGTTTAAELGVEPAAELPQDKEAQVAEALAARAPVDAARKQDGRRVASAVDASLLARLLGSGGFDLEALMSILSSQMSHRAGSAPSAAPMGRATSSGSTSDAQPARGVRAPTGDAPSTAAAKPAKPVEVKATKGMSEAQKFDYYQGLIEKSGGTFHGQPNARNIVGLRNETNANANGGRGAIDDKFVMLWRDKSGAKHVREFTGTTEGSASARGYSADVNGDGRNDMGRIPAGHYEYALDHSSTLGNVLRTTKAFRVQRDFNQDGKYTGKERAADVSNGFLFHQGTSAGCQTMDAANWGRFWGDLNSSGRPAKIGYTLIDA